MMYYERNLGFHLAVRSISRPVTLFILAEIVLKEVLPFKEALINSR
jgi:hypothetical protein